MRTTGNALFAAALVASVAVTGTGCTRDVQAMDAQQIESQYGLSGATNDTISTPDGPVRGTLVPVTLANGRQGQLFIPQRQANDLQAVYLRDEQGLHPIQLGANTTRAEVARAPAIVQTTPVAPSASRRSWEKEALIIGGSAGAGSAIGAIAKGKKGAAVGAAAGGVGGLIYDLITRNKKKK
jgi:hypothetical protein